MADAAKPEDVLELPVLQRCLAEAGVWSTGVAGIQEMQWNKARLGLLWEERAAGCMQITGDKVVSCRVCCTWKHHGRGDTGKIELCLGLAQTAGGQPTPGDEGELVTLNLSGISGQAASWDASVYLDESHPGFKHAILDRQQPGDWLSIYCSCRAKALYITDLRVTAACSQEAAAWLQQAKVSTPDSKITFAPWQVNRAWRDALWNASSFYTDVMAQHLLDFHGSPSEAMRRAMQSSSSVINSQQLAERVLQLCSPACIQESALQGKKSFYNRDDEQHLLQPLDPVWIPTQGARVLSCRVRCTWQDQGWGNRKGSLFLALMRKAGGLAEPVASLELFGIAEHDAREAAVLLDESHPQFKASILDQQEAGDWLSIFYRVGGGGGHTLHVSDLQLTAAHSKAAAAWLSSQLDAKLGSTRRRRLLGC